MAETKTSNSSEFFGPIIKITAISMIGTLGISWGLHLLGLRSVRAKNDEVIASIQFRTDQMKDYASNYKKNGKAAAIASLKN